MNPEELADLLKAMDSGDGLLVTELALQLSPLVFLHPSALRNAEWIEIDLENAQWDIPAEHMKRRRGETTTHIVPLSRQAVALLRELKAITGGGRYIFPSVCTAGPMSVNTLTAALRRLGYSSENMTLNGFRATARTILAEVLEVRIDLIEHQLGHIVKDPNGRAYNRTTFLKHRVQMMQLWADYLDSLKNGEKFVLDEEHYKLCRKQEY